MFSKNRGIIAKFYQFFVFCNSSLIQWYCICLWPVSSLFGSCRKRCWFGIRCPQTLPSSWLLFSSLLHISVCLIFVCPNSIFLQPSFLRFPFALLRIPNQLFFVRHVFPAEHQMSAFDKILFSVLGVVLSFFQIARLKYCWDIVVLYL